MTFLFSISNKMKYSSVHVYSGTSMCRLLQKTLNYMDDLALCSDDNDNDMPFVAALGRK